MKRFYFLVLVLLTAVTGWSQATYTYVGGNNSNWSASGSWSPARTSPLATDVLQFNGGWDRTINFPNSTTIQVGKLLISNNTTVRLTSVSDQQVLTITGGTGDDFVIEAGSNLVQFDFMNDIVMGTNTNAVINGTYTLQTNSGDGIFVTNNNASIAVNGSLIVQNSGGVNGASATKLVFNNGGRYVHDINGGTIPTATWNAGSILELAGVTNSFPNLNQNFSDVIFNSNITSGGVGIDESLNCRNLTIDAPGEILAINTSNGTNRTWNISGDMTITSIGTFYQSYGNAGTTINISGNLVMSAGTFVMKQSGGSATVNVTGNYSHNGGTLDMRAGGGGSTSTLTVNGNLSLAGGNIDMNGVNSSTGTINLRGNFTQTNGTLTETGSGSSQGAFNFAGTTPQSFTKLPGNGTISNNVVFTVTDDAIVSFDATSVVNGSGGAFVVAAGGKVITSNPAGLNNTGTNTGSVLTSTRTYDAGGDYEFRGAATGNFGAGTVRDLIINNTSGQVTLGRAFTVSRNLTLTNGYVTPNGGNTLLISTSGNASTANGAYVNGVLSKQINAANSSFTFPVGKVSGGLRIAGVTSAATGSGTTTFSAEFLDASPQAAYNSSVGSGIAKVSNCEYWIVNRTAGSRNASVTLSWNESSNCSGTSAYVTELSSLRVARFNGTSWTNAGSNSGANGGSILAAGTITSDLVTTFSPFTLATSNQAENPLPVLFADVKAYAKNDGIQVEWSNLTERDILNYVVERSANGIDFDAVNEQMPKRNLDDKASYTFFDVSPRQAANFYRIRVQEKGGKVIYSKILRVELGGNVKKAFSLYPNPVVGKQLTISLTGIQSGKYNLNVINTAGQVVFRKVIVAAGTGVTEMIELPASLKAGMYTGVMTGDNYQESKLFIVQ